MKIIATLTLIAALSLFCLPGLAAEAAQSQRPCEDVDLVGGTWKLVQFNETPAAQETTWINAIPYHYITFFQDRYYSFVAVDHELKTPAEVKTSFEWPQKSKHVLKYDLNNKGVLDLYIDKTLNYRYRCIAVTADDGNYKKNDLLLTGYSKDRQSQFFKLYRRWF